MNSRHAFYRSYTPYRIGKKNFSASFSRARLIQHRLNGRVDGLLDILNRMQDRGESEDFLKS